MCISDMSGCLRDIVPLILFGCKYNHNLLKYHDYAKKRRMEYLMRRSVFEIVRMPVHFPEKVLNDLNDPNDLKVFKDLNIPNKFDIPLAYSYLWLRLRYSRSAKSK